MFKHSLGRSARLFAAALALGAATLALPRTAHAQISIVVAADAEYTASEAELAQMFGGAVTAWASGQQVQIVDQPETPVGETFYADFIGRSVSQVRKAFTALLLSGQAPKPEQVDSDDDVKEAVNELAGSVGYIATSSLDDSVRELARIGG
jgi:ABC-type phosphate transport system substrate-binding protein